MRRHGRSGVGPRGTVRRRRRWVGPPVLGLFLLLLALAVTAGALLLTGTSPTAALSRDAGPAATPVPVLTEPGTSAPSNAVPRDGALTALEALPVKGRAPMTGYDRKAFGPAWTDVDRNGCDTRNDVLARDLTDRTVRPGTKGCVVVAGSLADPYGGQLVPFLKQDASKVQIDHVVAMGNAWATGAQAWDAERLRQFANDPGNLLATQGRLNQQKRAGDAATWLPPAKGFRCAYVARQVAVKAAYGLWVTPPEREAVARVLAACPDEPLPPVAGPAY